MGVNQISTIVTRLLPGRVMGRQVLLVLSGTAGGQVIMVACMPVIARLYGPSDFGAYSYITSLALIIAGIANLRLDGAVPLPGDTQTARDVIWLATFAGGTVALLTAIVVALVRSRVAPSHVLATGWAWWLPLMVFVIAQFALWTQAALRLEQYASVAKRPLIQSIGTVVLQMLLVPLRLGAAGLIVGQLGARILTTAQMARSASALWGRPHFAGMLPALKRYSNFPLVMAPAGVLNALGLYLPILLVTHYYGATAGGYVSLGHQLVLLPSATLGVAVGQVYVGKLAHNHRNKKGANRSAYLRASGWLLVCAVPFALLVIFLAPKILPALLGNTWLPVAPIAAAMSLAAACGLIASPLAYVMVAAERGRTVLLLDAFRVIAVGGAGGTAIYCQGSVLHVIMAMSGAQAVVYALTWLTCLSIVSGPEWR